MSNTANWGEIIGNIEAQKDLTELINSKVIPHTWGNITGSIEDNNALKNYIRNYYNCGTILGEKTQDTSDDNFYDIVRIGSQDWSKTSLRSNCYRDGTNIQKNYTGDPMIESNPKYKWVSPEKSEFRIGSSDLYTHDVISDNRGCCPLGFRIATIEDWTNLVLYLGNKIPTGGTSIQAEGNNIAFQKMAIANKFNSLEGNNNLAKFYLYPQINMFIASSISDMEYSDNGYPITSYVVDFFSTAFWCANPATSNGLATMIHFDEREGISFQQINKRYGLPVRFVRDNGL